MYGYCPFYSYTAFNNGLFSPFLSRNLEEVARRFVGSLPRIPPIACEAPYYYNYYYSLSSLSLTLSHQSLYRTHVHASQGVGRAGGKAVVQQVRESAHEADQVDGLLSTPKERPTKPDSQQCRTSLAVVLPRVPRHSAVASEQSRAVASRQSNAAPCCAVP